MATIPRPMMGLPNSPSFRFKALNPAFQSDPRRILGQQLQQQGLSSAPVQTPLQGLGRLSSALETGTELLGSGGRLITLGGSGEFFNIDTGKMLLKEIEIIGSRYCSKQEVIDSLNLVSRGLITPLVTEKVSPYQANDLHERIEKGNIIGRAGIIF